MNRLSLLFSCFSQCQKAWGLTAALALFCASGFAQAQATADAADKESPGAHYGAEAGPWYIVGNISMIAGSDAEFESTGDVGFRPDLAFGGAVGYRLNPIIRIEGELAYKQSELERLALNNGNLTTNVGGDLVMMSGMLNVIGDLPILDDYGRWRPWIGAGIGYATVEMKGGEFSVNGVTTRMNGEDQAFAYQAMAGIDYAFSDRVMFGLGYRYWGMSETEYNVEGSTAEANLGFYGGHELMGRMRYHF